MFFVCPLLAVLFGGIWIIYSHGCRDGDSASSLTYLYIFYSCKAELGRLQEECGRLQQRLMLVQDDCNRQLRVSQEERVST